MKATRKRWTQKEVREGYHLNPNDKITVCSSCLQASCWLGEFYCDRYKESGTVERTVRELIKLNLEHPDYWYKEKTAGEAIMSYGDREKSTLPDSPIEPYIASWKERRKYALLQAAAVIDVGVLIQCRGWGQESVSVDRATLLLAEIERHLPESAE